MTVFSPTAPARYTEPSEERSLGLEADSSQTEGGPSAAVSVLAKNAVSDLRRLRVEESEQSIYLSGRVRSFYHKQLAQEAIRPVAAGRQVINRVDVGEIS